jgi:hypothetical protein
VRHYHVSLTRDGFLLVAGAAGLAYEVIRPGGVRTDLMMIYLGMMGLSGASGALTVKQLRSTGTPTVPPTDPTPAAVLPGNVHLIPSTPPHGAAGAAGSGVGDDDPVPRGDDITSS